MTASAQFIAMLLDALRGLGPVTVKRMFGGAGVYADGVMFGLVADDVLYLKADAATKCAFEFEGQQPFIYDGKGKPISMSYWHAPERLYDDPDEMVEWARRALGVARSAAAQKAKPKTKLSRPSARQPTPKAKTMSRK